MSEELFPPDQISVDSPRIKWMKNHGIECYEIGEDEDGDPQWVARARKKENEACFHVVTKMSQDWALESLAWKLGIPDWRQS